MPQPTPPGTTPPPATRPAATPAPPRSRFKIYGICLLAGLLLGLIPTGVRLIQAQRERDALQQQLRVANLEMNLSSAAVMARHGDYTAARDAASRFFSDARLAVDSSDDETLTAAQLSNLQSVLADRDAVITLLARGDPAGAERLTTMYVAHRAAFPR
jgi:predicted exporter